MKKNLSKTVSEYDISPRNTNNELDEIILKIIC